MPLSISHGKVFAQFRLPARKPSRHACFRVPRIYKEVKNMT